MRAQIQNAESGVGWASGTQLRRLALAPATLHASQYAEWAPGRQLLWAQREGGHQLPSALATLLEFQRRHGGGVHPFVSYLHPLLTCRLPRGRIVEIYGPESSGKTTLALHVVAEAQQRGLNCVFVDAEHALDPAYATGLGVNLDQLYVSQPDTGEQALEITDTLVRSGGVDVVVVDSVAALVPKAELEGEMGDAHMALQARLMSQALRKLTASLSKTRTLIIFLNQIRSKVGVIFGTPEVTAGGNALKYYASMRIDIRRGNVVKDKDNADLAMASMTKVKVAKNKLAPPFRTAEFEMTYGRGINRTAEIVDLGCTCGVLRRQGAFYYIGDEALVAACNDALAKEAAGGGATAVVAATGAAAAAHPPPMPAPAKGKAAKGKKGKKGTAAADDAEAALEPAPVVNAQPAPAAPPTASPAPSAAPAQPALVLSSASPIAQGRERAKMLLDTHPALRDVLGAAVKRALLKRPSTPASPAAADASIEHHDEGHVEEADEFDPQQSHNG